MVVHDGPGFGSVRTCVRTCETYGGTCVRTSGREYITNVIYSDVKSFGQRSSIDILRVMGIFKNPSISLSLIPLSVIMMCECPALLLAGSLILKETKALY